MWNIIVGIVFIIGGLLGKIVLKDTNSVAFVGAGAGSLIWGIVQMARKMRNSGQSASSEQMSEEPEQQ